MRAVVISELSGPDAVRVVDLAEPTRSHMLTDDEPVVIDVVAAGVSFPDVLQSRGLYQLKPDLPFVPGAEVAGIVSRARPADDSHRATASRRSRCSAGWPSGPPRPSS